MSLKSKFKVGDTVYITYDFYHGIKGLKCQVVNPDYKTTFNFTNETIVRLKTKREGDKTFSNLNIPEKYLMTEEIYNSPLFRAMKEEDEV